MHTYMKIIILSKLILNIKQLFHWFYNRKRLLFCKEQRCKHKVSFSSKGLSIIPEFNEFLHIKVGLELHWERNINESGF